MATPSAWYSSRTARHTTVANTHRIVTDRERGVADPREWAERLAQLSGRSTCKSEAAGRR
jgi:hypothetical protein